MRYTSEPLLRNASAAQDKRSDPRLEDLAKRLDAKGYAVGLFWIPSQKLSQLDTIIERLQRRASRLGVQPIVYEKGESYWTKVSSERATSVAGGWSSTTTDVRTQMTPVLVAGQEPRLRGWHLVASLDYDEPTSGGEPWVRVVPGRVLPVEFRTVDPTRCDHCHTKRDRSSVFVLGHEDGRYAAVGRTCLMDFMGGHGDPKTAASASETLFAIFDAARGLEDSIGGGFGGSAAEAVGLESYLATVASKIRENGWMSRAQAYETGRLSTADQAWLPKQADVRSEDEDMARRTIEWATAEFADPDPSTLTDYGYNCRQVILSGVATRRSMGVAASLIPAYQRSVSREFERKQSADSQHVGTVGDRIVLDLTFTSARTFQGDYALSYICMFTDANGNVFKWFASSWIFDFPYADAPGKQVKLKATIKKHGEYKGVKETHLSRAAIEVEKAPAVKRPRGSKRLVRMVDAKMGSSHSHEILDAETGEMLAELWHTNSYLGWRWHANVEARSMRGEFASLEEVKEAVLKKLKAVEQVTSNARSGADASEAQIAEMMRVLEREASDGDRLQINRKRTSRNKRTSRAPVPKRNIGPGAMGHGAGTVIDPDSVRGAGGKAIDSAMDRYEVFHAKKPMEVVEVSHDPPEFVVCIGFAVSTSYRTDKWYQDGQDTDYKHLHDEEDGRPYHYDLGEGVQFFENADLASRADVKKNGRTRMPKKYPKAWTRLGKFLGSDIRHNGGGFQEVDSNQSAKDCWLLCSPSGDMLAIYSPHPQHDGSEGFLAFMCGGNLRVIEDGIDG